LRYGFREFTQKKLLKAGEAVESLPVWFGSAASVPVAAKEDVLVTLPHNAEGIAFHIAYKSPVPAPVKAGDQLAELKITLPARDAIIVPLYAGADVEKLTGFARFKANLSHLLTGK
jgi:D-alanyl-D-alanine carboxypeptidase (penicillin-binding protein 5/6)